MSKPNKYRATLKTLCTKKSVKKKLPVFQTSTVATKEHILKIADTHLVNAGVYGITGRGTGEFMHQVKLVVPVSVTQVLLNGDFFQLS